ncbi:MAG: hypothetical protein EXS55_03445 [Candidatus Magasanikbacteria bacterium]|nr:hypothetical protein [Candidatus Magasanikbacteria bacterium]
MAQDLITQLKNLRVGPIDPKAEWVAENRRLLLTQIKNTMPVAAPVNVMPVVEQAWEWLSIFMPANVARRVVRPLAVLMVVLLVATQLVNNVDAAYEALPGDWLYPAKRATEKTQVAMAIMMGNQNSETKLHIKLAQRRAEETKKILQRTDTPANTAVAAATMVELKNEIATVSLQLTNSKDTALNADAAKDVKQNSEQIKDVLQAVKNNLLVSTTTADVALSKEVSATKDLVNDVSVQAVEVLVAKHLEGDTSVSKADVTKALDKSLQSAASNAAASKQNVGEIKTIVDSVKIEIKDLTSDFKKQGGENLAVATNTKQFAEQINLVANQTIAAVLKTEAVSASVDKQVTAAQELLSTGDLSKAINTIKQITEASKEAEKISETSLHSVQSLLPIVQVIKDNNPVAVSSTVGIIVLPANGIIMVSGTAVLATTTSGILKVTVTVTGTPIIKK